MKRLLALASVFALFGMISFISADEPKKADEPKIAEMKNEDIVKKLLGVWEVTKSDESQPELEGAILTFEKEGKLTMELKGGQKMDMTYEVEKGKLVTKIEGSSDTDEIKKLTDKDVELENGDKKVTVLKRSKKKSD